MTRGEKLFLVGYGLVLFPLLLLYLHMVHGLENPVMNTLLVYMGSLKVVYAGARGFETWNSEDDPVDPGTDGGHKL